MEKTVSLQSPVQVVLYVESWQAVTLLASHTDLFRGARLSSLPTNACSTKNNIPFSLFYSRGK